MSKNIKGYLNFNQLNDTHYTIGGIILYIILFNMYKPYQLINFICFGN